MKLARIGMAAAFILAGCTTNPYTGQPQLSKTAVGAGTGAVIGGVAGAIIGKQSGNSRRGALIGAGVGALAGGGIGAYQDNQEARLRERLANSGVSVTRVGNDIVLDMPSNITFDVDRSDIKPQFYDVLSSVAVVLNEFNQTLVDVEGHTDADGSDAYNFELSQDRAESVGRFLVSQQVDARRVSVEGLGETRPVASNASAAGKARNRRVEIHIVPLT